MFKTIKPQVMTSSGLFPLVYRRYEKEVILFFLGEDDISKMGQIHAWNYTTQVPFFPGECGKVYGAGEFPSPGQNRTKLEMFSNDLCRTLIANYVQDNKVEGINVYT